MKTLFVSYRVTDLDRSLGFYTTLGYAELGRVEGGDGARLVILKFADEPAASLELVHRPGDGPVDVGSGFDHLTIQVEALATTLETLTEAGRGPEPLRYPGGSHGPKTSWLTDPDGYRIELVEWPSGHLGGITAEDFALGGHGLRSDEASPSRRNRGATRGDIRPHPQVLTITPRTIASSPLRGSP